MAALQITKGYEAVISPNNAEIRPVGNAHPTEYKLFGQFINAYFSAIRHKPRLTPTLYLV